MNKKTQMWIGILAIAGGAYWLMTQKKKDRVFANLRGGFAAPPSPPGCQIYEGPCTAGGSGVASVGTIIQGWSGTDGIIVANSSTRCIVCPKSDTPTGLPISDK